MNVKVEDEIKLAEEILEEIQSQKLSENLRVQELLLKYHLVVKMMGKSEEIKWADQELDGYKSTKNIPYYRKLRLNPNINPDNVHGYILDNCEEIENKVKADKLFPYYAYKGNRLSSNTIYIKPEGHLNILNNLRNEIYRKTTSILLESKYEKMESDIFEETRETVNKRLHEICPKTLNKLMETYEDMVQSRTPLDLQQIALACRIVLKDFADTVYPPSNQTLIGADEKKHNLKDDDYVNRILAYVQKNTHSDSDDEFMQSSLNYLANFLFSINKLANVGTHNERSKEHAKRCVVYTYLILGDIINLTENK